MDNLSRIGHLGCWWVWKPSYKEQLKELEMFSLEKRRIRINMSAVSKYLMGCHAKEGRACSLWLLRAGLEPMSRKTGKRCWLATRKNFPTARAAWPWKGFLWAVVVLPSFEVSQQRLDSPLQGFGRSCLCWARGWASWSPRLHILWFVRYS